MMNRKMMMDANPNAFNFFSLTVCLAPVEDYEIHPETGAITLGISRVFFERAR